MLDGGLVHDTATSPALPPAARKARRAGGRLCGSSRHLGQRSGHHGAARVSAAAPAGSPSRPSPPLWGRARVSMAIRVLPDVALEAAVSPPPPSRYPRQRAARAPARAAHLRG